MSTSLLWSSWTIHGFGRERLVLQLAHVPVPTGHHVLPLSFALDSVRCALFDADERRHLYKVYEALRAPLGVFPLQDPNLDCRIEETILGSIQRGDLVVLAEERAPNAATRRPSTAPPPPVPSAPEPAGEQLSFYELVVLDELETPIAGLRMTLSTPAGTVTRRTDANGKVRIDNVPGGFGSARVTALAEFAALLAGREHRSRRVAPLPQGESVHVRTPLGLSDAIVLPDGEPQKLLIVSRTQLRHSANAHPLPELSLDEGAPCALDAGEQLLLELCSNAQGQNAVMRTPTPAAPLPEPPAPPLLPLDNSVWIAPNIYVVQAGDTLTKIALRYLRDGARWKEIWALNKERYPNRSPDLIYPGDTFAMPPEAIPPWVSFPQSPPPQPHATPPMPSEPPPWLKVAIDAAHEALFHRNFDAVWALLESVAVQPPVLPPPELPPYREELAFRAAMLELTLEGCVDPPIHETKQV